MTDQERVWASLQLQVHAPELVLDEELFYLMTHCPDPLLYRVFRVLCEYPKLTPVCHAARRMGGKEALRRLVEWAEQQ